MTKKVTIGNLKVWQLYETLMVEKTIIFKGYFLSYMPEKT